MEYEIYASALGQLKFHGQMVTTHAPATTACFPRDLSSAGMYITRDINLRDCWRWQVLYPMVILVVSALTFTYTIMEGLNCNLKNTQPPPVLIPATFLPGFCCLWSSFGLLSAAYVLLAALCCLFLFPELF